MTNRNNTPPVPAMTYFFPSEEQNRLRKKQNMVAWRLQARNVPNLTARRREVNVLARRE